MRRGGVHLALDESQVRRLEDDLAQGGNAAALLWEAADRLLDHEPARIALCDDSWRTIHDALTTGEPTGDGGDEPLSYAVLGGRVRDAGPTLLRLKAPAVVADVAEALHDLHRFDFMERCDALETLRGRPPLPEADRMVAWRWLRRIAELFRSAARDRRWVLFGVVQEK